MTKEQIIADLDYVSSIAKDGANSPLLGGRIGLMWGILLTLVFFGQWAILSKTFDVSPNNIGFLWIAFAVIGGAGSAIMGRKIDSKPGANSVANRVETYVWIMFAGYMATLFVGVILNMFIQNGGPQSFDYLVIAGFAGQGLAYGVVAKLTGLRWIHFASFMSFSSSALCFSLLGTINIYVVASIAAFITVVIPSLISLKKETQNG
ncbi:MAG: hypothetical protein ABJN69_03065 [Hellea sp.]